MCNALAIDWFTDDDGGDYIERVNATPDESILPPTRAIPMTVVNAFLSFRYLVSLLDSARIAFIYFDVVVARRREDAMSRESRHLARENRFSNQFRGRIETLPRAIHDFAVISAEIDILQFRLANFQTRIYLSRRITRCRVSMRHAAK